MIFSRINFPCERKPKMRKATPTSANARGPNERNSIRVFIFAGQITARNMFHLQVFAVVLHLCEIYKITHRHNHARTRVTSKSAPPNNAKQSFWCECLWRHWLKLITTVLFPFDTILFWQAYRNGPQILKCFYVRSAPVSRSHFNCSLFYYA